MLSQERQSIQTDLCHTPKISRSLLQSEDLVRGAATRTKTALNHLPVLILLFPGRNKNHYFQFFIFVLF